ncbi:MAG: hypothetical protein ABR985_03840 [Methanotrichaceae archaeon]|jgi:hypothetical protein
MLLSEKQRKYLLERETLDVQSRKTNDYAVRNHLKDYLDDADDALFILHHLPPKQIQKIVSNKNYEHILNFLDLAHELLKMYELDYGFVVRAASFGEPKLFSFSENDPIMSKALKNHIKELTEICKIVDAKAGLADLIADAKHYGQEPHKQENVSLDVDAMEEMAKRTKDRMIR